MMQDVHRQVRFGGKTHLRTMEEMREHREKWDRRFIDMMNVVGSWSRDPSTKVGAVIVRPDLTVAAVGYNGFPRGMSDDAELYEHRPTKYSRIIHGEMNAILNAHGDVAGCTLYVPFPPCDRCAVHVVQAGIKRVVYVEPTEDIKSRWAEAFEMTAAIFADAGMEVTVLPLDEDKVERKFGNVPVYPKCEITITMPSVDGKQLVGGGHNIDLDFLASKVNIETDADRLAYANKLLNLIGEIALDKVDG
jgi:dCMP deaminase